MNIGQCYRSTFVLIMVFTLCLAKSKRRGFDTIVSFGDSNSDIGNYYKLSGDKRPSPPYYQGRFSDGPLWVERSEILNLHNYAYAGATTDNEFANASIYDANLTTPGVRQQIKMYKNSVRLSRTDFSRALYLIWIGIMDYVTGETNASAVVNRLGKSIEDLVKIGVKHLLVVNQLSFQAYPLSRESEMYDQLGKISSEHNNNLSQSIQMFRKNFPRTSFYLLDVHSLIEDIVANSSRYGITNLTNCWYMFEQNTTVACGDPSSFLFVDEMHLTSRVHQLIADRARKLLTSNGMIPYTFSSSLSITIFTMILSKNFI